MSRVEVLEIPSDIITRFMVKMGNARIPWLPMILLGVILFTSIFASLLTHHDPEDVNLQNKFQPPSWLEGGNDEFLLGTDSLGRDLLTRILYGGRASLIVGIVVVALGGLIGLTLGIVAGYVKGIVGDIIMRLVDSLMAIPSILIAIVFAVTLGPSMRTVIVALTIVIWARFARVIRGEVLALCNSGYVLQAKVDGASPLRIMYVHIVPNVFNTFVILFALNLGSVILVEASLSFLGAGIPPPTPTWGQMVSEGKDSITTAWWIIFFPGLAIALVVLAVNLLGDWLRDRLDPKLRQF